jgi:hypothetical protein
MSDPKTAEPDEDLLEFLGGIDEGNEDSRESDFSDFLANADIDKVAGKRRESAKEGKNE